MDASTITASQKDEFMDQYKQQLAVAQTQELLSIKFLHPTDSTSSAHRTYEMEWDYSECGDSDLDEPGSFSEQTETVKLLEEKFDLPKGLCAQPEVFYEFFAMEHLWKELPTETCSELMALLPEFPQNDALEKKKTIEKLFNYETFRFNSSPLVEFQKNLEDGHYLSDVVRYRSKVAKSERHEQRYQECERISRLAQKLASSRGNLLNVAYKSPLYAPLELRRSADPEAFTESVATRARKRYLNEIATVSSESNLPFSASDDEISAPIDIYSSSKPLYSTGRAAPVVANVGSDNGEIKIHSTFSYKHRPQHHPEAVINDLFNTDNLKVLLRRHKKCRAQESDPPEPDYYSEVHVPDVLLKGNADLANAIKKTTKVSNPKIKPESPVVSTKFGSLNDDGQQRLVKYRSTELDCETKLAGFAVKRPIIDSQGSTLAKKQKTAISSPIVAHVSVDEPTSIVDVNQACFMSLIRTIFCSTPDHRITLDKLTKAVSSWLRNRVDVNEWFADCPSWLDELVSVVKFLAGEFMEQPADFVPYVEYKANLQIYQWIGAGRDTDQHLLPLYRFWWGSRYEFGKLATVPDQRKPPLVNVSSNPLRISCIPSLDRDAGDGKEGEQSRCPTSWIMRPETLDEIELFREQERRRYNNPLSAFTYRMHGFESVVGPVRGLFAQVLPKGTSFLSEDRLPGVTFLSLVRDAVGRLPNGEGSKAHICELLKASQYIVPGNGLQGAINQALDRLQNDQERCVLFDGNRKVFVYLPRTKSELEFSNHGGSMSSGNKIGDGRAIGRANTNLSTGSILKPDFKVVSDLSKSIIIRSTNSSTPVVGNGPMVHKIQTITKRNVLGSPNSSLGGNRLVAASGNLSNDLPPLNKIVTPAVAQRDKIVVGRRVVRGDTKDIEANLDAKHPPALIHKLPYGKTPLKVATSSGVQTFHVTTLQSSTQHRQQIMSLLTTAQGQSMLMHNPRNAKSSNSSQSVLIPSSNQPALATAAATGHMAYIPGDNRGNAIVGKVITRVGSGPASLSNVTRFIQTNPNITMSPRKSLVCTTTTTETNMNPIQICTTRSVSAGEIMTTNVLRNSTAAFVQQKPLIQKIVIRSNSPHGSASKRNLPLPAYSTKEPGVPVKPILLTNTTSDGNNVMKIRPSMGEQAYGNSNMVISRVQSPKPTAAIGASGGPQLVRVQSSLHSPSSQQFILNSNRQTMANQKMNLTSQQLAIKTPTKTISTPNSQSHLVQLPAKTFIKGTSVMARVMKTTSSDGLSVPTTSTMVRTVGGVQRAVAGAPEMRQMVTLIKAGGAKATSRTPIRVGRATGAPGSLIQLTANGDGKYSVSPGRSVIEIQHSGMKTSVVGADQLKQHDLHQQHNVKVAGNQSNGGIAVPKLVSMKPSGVGNQRRVTTNIKTGLRVVNTTNMNVANIGGKPVLITGKLPGNVASLIRSTAAAATGGNKLSLASSSTEADGVNAGRGITNVQLGNQTVNSMKATTKSPIGATQHLMIGNQLVKIQSPGSIGTPVGNVTVKGGREVVTPTTTGPKAVILNANVGQTYKVQSLVHNPSGKIIKTVSGVPKSTVVMKNANTFKSTPLNSGSSAGNRVVFVQGNSGGQILLPSGSGSISLKSLQGLKMISVQQQPQPNPPQTPK